MVDQGLGEFELAAIANLGLDTVEEARELVPSVFAGVLSPPPPFARAYARIMKEGLADAMLAVLPKQNYAPQTAVVLSTYRDHRSYFCSAFICWQLLLQNGADQLSEEVVQQMLDELSNYKHA